MKRPQPQKDQKEPLLPKRTAIENLILFGMILLGLIAASMLHAAADPTSTTPSHATATQPPAVAEPTARQLNTTLQTYTLPLIPCILYLPHPRVP